MVVPVIFKYLKLNAQPTTQTEDGRPVVHFYTIFKNNNFQKNKRR